MIAAALLLAALPLFGQESPALPAATCGSELAAAEEALARIPPLDRDRLARGVRRATVMFRFRRTKEAIRQIDRVHMRLGGAWGQRVPAGVRAETLSAIAALRDCVSTARPPAFATLKVRTFKEDNTKPDNRGQQAGAGVLVRVEDESVGRTGPDGTLTAQVPSGPILVTAIVPPGELGWESVTLRAGRAATVSLILQSDAEPGDEIDVDLVEAEDDVLQRTVKSFTLRFTRDGMAVPVTHDEEVKVLTREGTTASYLDDLFTISNGAVVAKDVARVLAALGAYTAPIILRVAASDKDELVYYGTVAFRIE
jgi:hypothetical protein